MTGTRGRSDVQRVDLTGCAKPAGRSASMGSTSHRAALHHALLRRRDKSAATLKPRMQTPLGPFATNFQTSCLGVIVLSGKC